MAIYSYSSVYLL